MENLRVASNAEGGNTEGGNTEGGNTEGGNSEDSKSGRSSPEPCCPICLQEMKENKSFTDSCIHQFCFGCIERWSKVKPVCPLCKQPFKAIYHNVRTIEDFDEYILPTPIQAQDDESETEMDTRLNQVIRSYANYLVRLEEVMNGPMLLQTMSHQLQGQDENSVSHNGQGINHLVFANRHSPEPAPDFFRRHPDMRPRLTSWLHRELNMLGNDNAHTVMALIFDLISRVPIHSHAFFSQVALHLGNDTERFMHSFYRFAATPFSVNGNDNDPPPSNVTHNSPAHEDQNPPVSDNNSQAHSDRILPSSNNQMQGVSPAPMNDASDNEDCVIVAVIQPPRLRRPQVSTGRSDGDAAQLNNAGNANRPEPPPTSTETATTNSLNVSINFSCQTQRSSGSLAAPSHRKPGGKKVQRRSGLGGHKAGPWSTSYGSSAASLGGDAVPGSSGLGGLEARSWRTQGGLAPARLNVPPIGSSGLGGLKAGPWSTSNSSSTATSNATTLDGSVVAGCSSLGGLKAGPWCTSFGSSAAPLNFETPDGSVVPGCSSLGGHKAGPWSTSYGSSIAPLGGDAVPGCSNLGGLKARPWSTHGGLAPARLNVPSLSGSTVPGCSGLGGLKAGAWSTNNGSVVAGLNFLPLSGDAVLGCSRLGGLQMQHWSTRSATLQDHRLSAAGECSTTVIQKSAVASTSCSTMCPSILGSNQNHTSGLSYCTSNNIFSSSSLNSDPNHDSEKMISKEAFGSSSMKTGPFKTEKDETKRLIQPPTLPLKKRKRPNPSPSSTDEPSALEIYVGSEPEGAESKPLLNSVTVQPERKVEIPGLAVSSSSSTNDSPDIEVVYSNIKVVYDTDIEIVYSNVNKKPV